MPRLPIEESGTALFQFQWSFPLQRRLDPVDVIRLFFMQRFELCRL
jgi:hypothetical protein